MKEIKLTQGKVALVDDEDFEYLNQWKWCAHKERHNWYAIRSAEENGKRMLIRMHRIIINPVNNLVVDHTDGDGLNNQKINLRACTIAENTCNKRPHNNSSSKFLGVCLSVVRTEIKGRFYEYNYWSCQVMKNGKRVYSKRFKTESEAALKYNEVAMKVHGQFARLNSVKQLIPIHLSQTA